MNLHKDVLLRSFMRNVIISVLFIVVLKGLPLFAEGNFSRLDLFDAQGNHLMFVTFDYDQDGENTGRSVFMSDSTFMRSTKLIRDEGRVLKEISYNFNGDTVFTTDYTYGVNTSFLVRDQFKLNSLGGPLSYKATTSPS